MKNGGNLESGKNVITYEEICANLREAVNIYCEQKSEEKVRAFVKKQRTQIGTLKALGFKNNKIIRHYISYGFYISIVASIVAVVVGDLSLGKFFLNMEVSYFEMPVYHTVILPIVYILAIAVILLITFVTYLSCRKVLKEPASEALRLEIPKLNKLNSI